MITSKTHQASTNSDSDPSSDSTPNPDLNLDLIIGDLDSLTPTSQAFWEKRHTQILRDSDQESTDFEKAYRWIRKKQSSEVDGGRKTSDIVVLGGLGGRVDQGLSMMHHLYLFQKEEEDFQNGKMYLFSEESITFVLRTGKHRIKVIDGGEHGVKLGRYIGIIPIKEGCCISTSGLRWDVQDWRTEFGGRLSTSNQVREEWVEVECTGDVLFTINLVFLDGVEE